MQHLPGAHAVRLRLVRLDILHCTWLISPGVIDQKFRIYPKHPVQQFFIIILTQLANRTPGNIPHRVNTLLRKLFCISMADSPKVCQWLMRPQQSSIFSFIQTRNPHAVSVRRNMLRHNIHGNLAEIQIRADPRRRRDARHLQHIPDDLSRKLLRRHLIRVQIMRHIHKHLVNRVHMHIFRCHVFEINIVNASAVLQILCHLRRRCHVICLHLRTIF